MLMNFSFLNAVKPKLANNNRNPLNGQCDLAAGVSILWELKDKMTRQHWEILGQTPFGHLMDVEPIMQE